MRFHYVLLRRESPSVALSRQGDPGSRKAIEMPLRHLIQLMPDGLCQVHESTRRSTGVRLDSVTASYPQASPLFLIEKYFPVHRRVVVRA